MQASCQGHVVHGVILSLQLLELVLQQVQAAEKGQASRVSGIGASSLSSGSSKASSGPSKQCYSAEMASEEALQVIKTVSKLAGRSCRSTGPADRC